MNIDANIKTVIENNIVRAIIKGLEEGKLKEADLPQVAEFVLSKIDQINEHTQLMQFLDELSQKWPVFSEVESMQRAQYKEVKERSAENDVLQLAKSGQVEEAIKLAKNTMGK